MFLASYRIIVHKMRLNGNVRCVFTKSGSEPTQQTKQPNLLRSNKTLASLQLDKQNTEMFDKQTTIQRTNSLTRQNLMAR